MTDDLAAAQARLRRFGEAECRGHAPLYEQLAIAASDDPEVAGLLLAAPVAQRRGTTFFAAVHYSLLRKPSHPLTAFYPSTGGDPTTGDAYPAFRAFCLAREDELREILASRATQTNEVRRCAALLPALAPIGRDGPITLIEIGASAGLNLLLDRYRYDYGPSGALGDPSSPVLIAPQLLGETPPPVPEAMPVVAQRIGVDLAPVDLRDPDARLWLRACVWAEHLERAVLLARAMEMAMTDPPRVIAADLLEALPTLAADSDPATVVCVMSSNVLPYLSQEQIRTLVALLDEMAAERELHWLSSEGIDLRFSWIPSAAEPSVSPYAMAVHRSRFHRGTRSGEQLAYAGPHGDWLQWVGT